MNRFVLMRVKKIYALQAIPLFIFGIAVFITDGFGITWVRFYVGDVAAILFLYTAISCLWDTLVRKRVLAVLSIALAIEFTQVFFSADTEFGVLVFGTTFDWLDVLLYALTLFLVFIVEHIVENGFHLHKNIEQP